MSNRIDNDKNPEYKFVRLVCPGCEALSQAHIDEVLHGCYNLQDECEFCGATVYLHPVQPDGMTILQTIKKLKRFNINYVFPKVDTLKDKHGMDVSAFEARHASELQDEPLEEVHSKIGMIPADHALELVQCPFERNIAAAEVDLPMCPRAKKCTLVGYMDLCTVPHVHDFESPGIHTEHKPATKSDGFSLELALSRVEKATWGVRHMKRDGLIVVAPKRSRYKSKRAASTGPVNMKTRAEAYSVYDFNTTPPAVDKTEVIMTRAEKWGAADRKETKRIQFIQDCRDFKIDAMLATA